MVDTESIKSIKPAIDASLMVVPPMSKDEEDRRIMALVNTPALDWQQPAPKYGSRCRIGEWKRRCNGLQHKRPWNVYVLPKKTHTPTNVGHRRGDQVHASLSALPVQSNNPIIEVPQTKSNSNEDSNVKVLVDAPAVDTSAVKHVADELDEFCKELYDIPDIKPIPSSKLIPTMDSNIKVQADIPTLDLQQQGPLGSDLDACGLSYGLQQSTLPPGYVCHRCKVPGHLIKNCPTNGDPMKRVRPPSRILRAMLVVKPDEASFEKEMEGIPSTVSLSSPKIHSSSASSNGSKTEHKVSMNNEEETKVEEALSYQEKLHLKASRIGHDDDDVSKVVDGSLIVNESTSSQDRTQLVKEEAQQKLATNETEKKKRQKKAHLPTNEFEWKTAEGYGAEEYMIGGYNPYWNGMNGFVAPLPPYAIGAMQMEMNMMMPFGNFMHQFPFSNNNYILPVFPPLRCITIFLLHQSVQGTAMTMESIYRRINVQEKHKLHILLKGNLSTILEMIITVIMIKIMFTLTTMSCVAAATITVQSPQQG